jgi:hypothetical protein
MRRSAASSARAASSSRAPPAIPAIGLALVANGRGYRTIVIPEEKREPLDGILMLLPLHAEERAGKAPAPRADAAATRVLYSKTIKLKGMDDGDFTTFAISPCEGLDAEIARHPVQNSFPRAVVIFPKLK